MRHRLNIPDRVRILLDTSIAAEKSHPAHARDTFADPLILILIRLIHERMRRDVRVEIVRDKIIVPMVGDGTAQGAESAGVAKRVGFDGVEDFRKVGVQRKGAEVVGVAKVFDVFGEIAEEEDVGVANLARYFNLFLRGKVIYVL